MLRANIVPPFALSDGELTGIANFAHANGLDEISKLIAELRTLRVEFVSLSGRVGKMQAMIEALQHDPQKRFAKTMEVMINATPVA